MKRKRSFQDKDTVAKVLKTNDDYNCVVDIIEYHIIQDIVDNSDKKGKFGGCLSVRMNLVER